MSQAVKTCFVKCKAFDSRAGRRELWLFYAFVVLIYCVGIALLESNGGLAFRRFFGMVLQYEWWSIYISGAVLVVPMGAALTRRLHDVGVGGEWIFIGSWVAAMLFTLLLIVLPRLWVISWSPYGFLAVLLVLFLYYTTRPSQPVPNEYDPNKYGPNPTEVST